MEQYTVQTELRIFYDALKTDSNIYGWVYDAGGNLLYTNCRHHFLAIAFKHNRCKNIAMEYGVSHTSPIIITGNRGAMWCIVSEHSNSEFVRFYVLGPVYSTSSSSEEIKNSLNDYEIDETAKEQLIAELSSLPYVSSTTFFHDCILLHYFVNRKKISRSDIHFQSVSPGSTDNDNKSEPINDRKGTYAAERELLRMIREGNPDYKKALRNAMMVSSGVHMKARKSLDQAKISCITFVSLSARAAIEGGLSPETAYTVQDSYIQAIYECRQFGDIVSISHSMYEDFIQRVNNKKNTKKLSYQIQSVYDTILYHCTDDLTLSYLASKVFYNEAYLSRKFREETGFNIHSFIIETRIKSSASDLENTDMTINDIAGKYHFSSSNHYSQCFKKYYKVLPGIYRKNNKKI